MDLTQVSPESPASTAAAERLDPADGRHALARALSETAQLPGVDLQTLAWLGAKLAEESFNLVVAGQFKRGKSSVINALLGEALLPVGVVPLTSVVTVIRSGTASHARVERLNGGAQDVPLSRLDEYVTERGNPRNVKGVRQVVIEHPSPWLARGVQLIDTPGIGSVHEHNTEVTRRFLPQADAVLFIASVDQPVSQAEIEFLAGIREHAGKVFCLLNKMDSLRIEERDEAMAFAQGAIRDALGTEVPIFAVSALKALEGEVQGRGALPESGFPVLATALRRFMAQERREVWLRCVARTLLKVLAQTRFALELESRVLSTPLAELESRLAAFAAKKQALERARADYQVLLEADARALMKERIEPALTDLQHAEQARLERLIGEWFTELRSQPARKLDALLEARTAAEIRAGYDVWMARTDPEIGAAFEQLCARFFTAMQGSVEELMRYSCELFAVSFEAVQADAQWSTDSSFYYKLWYEPTGLAILSSSLVSILPQAFSASWVVRRRRSAALDLIETQAARIRYDLDERLKQSVREARQHMVQRIGATIAGIEAAIERGLAAQRQSAQAVTSHSARVAATLAALSAIEGRVRAVEEPRV